MAAEAEAVMTGLRKIFTQSFVIEENVIRPPISVPILENVYGGKQRNWRILKSHHLHQKNILR